MPQLTDVSVTYNKSACVCCLISIAKDKLIAFICSFIFFIYFLIRNTPLCFYSIRDKRVASSHAKCFFFGIRELRNEQVIILDYRAKSKTRLRRTITFLVVMKLICVFFVSCFALVEGAPSFKDLAEILDPQSKGLIFKREGKLAKLSIVLKYSTILRKKTQALVEMSRNCS